MKDAKVTREVWLRTAVEELRPMFAAAGGVDLPEKLRVSAGWPHRGGTSTRKRVLGECWKPETGGDGTSQIFISPLLVLPVEVLAVLVHELIHAALPEAKHGPDFKAAMKKLGLVGKATATQAGDELRAKLEMLAEELGDYDNSTIDLKAQSADSPKPQKNRQRKIFCPKTQELHDGAGDYILRASKKTIDLGLPECPLCGTQLEAEVEEDGDDENEGKE